MPAKKAARRSVKRYQVNHSIRSATRTAVGGARRAVDSGNAEAAATAVHDAISILDKAVKKGILHKNNASRSKSRLAAKLNRMQAAP
ncbi:MAG TPA: 30S ribosomal protein S20 [Dehalococcoidia bacterium]|nr:30S ribosomal protein S20 [Dehalococcoidia bacterium]